MAITDWPATERPRERLLEHGADTLSDAELLAIFLRTGHRGVSAVALARELLTRFDGLRGLLEADREQFCAYPGLGDAKYTQLQAVLAMARRYLATELDRGEALTSPRATAEYLRAQLRHQQREVFGCLFLDNRHRVLRFEEMFHGTIDAAAVYPREIVRRALALNAAAVIAAHNHPSGVTEPSRADEQITRRLRDALALVDVRLLDHFVIGDGAPVSLAERGLV
ncbi:DNA repair protein RadC [Aquisalimonas lutea]|uniref:RadC family protein n=1 Tax=Aquisalimonas lutea TaxID=1327750 RepID=UPI0025B52AA5|nr:DNA repair protein RadC [Aquisalimonas lutea]MDN3516343.1 DNA repair protein RadC [Aquisalimonas lutea]